MLSRTQITYPFVIAQVKKCNNFISTFKLYLNLSFISFNPLPPSPLDSSSTFPRLLFQSEHGTTVTSTPKRWPPRRSAPTSSNFAWPWPPRSIRRPRRWSHLYARGFKTRRASSTVYGARWRTRQQMAATPSLLHPHPDYRRVLAPSAAHAAAGLLQRALRILAVGVARPTLALALAPHAAPVPAPVQTQA